MAISLKDLRKKIKSIQGTKKLTQAMQMVSASKMQKATRAAETSRDYSKISWEIIKNIRSGTDISNHPLLAIKPIKNMAIILITSNKGLCGALNTQIIRKLSGYIKDKKEKNITIELITVGNKGKNFAARYLSELLVADFPAVDRTIEFNDITTLAKIVLDDYQSGKYDKVTIFYNHFVSTLKQEALRRQLLPIPDLQEVEEFQLGKSEILNSKSETNSKSQTPNFKNIEYKFEPDAKSILDTLLPTVIRIQIFQILLEASASEHSARMVAMKNATDNASDLIDDLTLTYNSLRQAVITREITEISAGAEALKN